MGNSKKFIVTLIIIAVLGVVAYFSFFRESNDGALEYQITSSGITSSGSDTTPTIESGSVSVGKKNLQIVAYVSDLKGAVEKTNTEGTKMNIKVGEVITRTDTIATLAGASASLVFIDNSVVRLGENSRIQITKKAGKSIELTLLDGDIWARVLKPLYDTSFFTIKTADVSAGVRGTSIRIKRTTEKIKITVIDSYAANPDLAGADIEYGQGKKFLPKEHSMEFDLTKKERKEKQEDKKNLFADEFIRENTQKDLIYMNTLDSIAESPELKKRLEGEFKVTMPAQDEVEIFFDEAKIKAAITQTLVDQKKTMTDEKMLEMIKKDLTIRAIRQEMHPYVSGGGSGAPTLTPEQKKEMDKKIEDVISGKMDKLPEEKPMNDRLMLDGQLIGRNREGRDLLDLGQRENTHSGTTQSGATQSGEILPPPTKEQAPDCTPELIKQQVQCRVVRPIKEQKPIVLDDDKDGVPNDKDNCPKVANPDQKNSYGDSRGDACEPKEILPLDTDKDGIPDSKDNCPKIANPGQENTYGDTRGDACEPKEILPLDTDKDGIPDGKDNCPKIANPDQKNSYGDARGDACEQKLVRITCGGTLCAEGVTSCTKIPLYDETNTNEDHIQIGTKEICAQ